MEEVDGARRTADFSDLVAALERGEVAIVRDAGAVRPAASRTFNDMPCQPGQLGQLGIRAAMAAPLIMASRLVAADHLHAIPARDWTDGELALVADAAERGRAEAALRDGEEQQRLTLQLVPGCCDESTMPVAKPATMDGGDSTPASGRPSSRPRLARRSSPDDTEETRALRASLGDRRAVLVRCRFAVGMT